ncbi:chorismate mutase 2 isoform X3 [Hevea brasiliensis]|uniref:chorismate mutase 2 isoform X3 n=1 Tax=Hevea brasiliensis TaxID=3981 RepID=UPI0025FF7729|nr:chorismate mutase 2 isoform X3 [Hevea brasiliensis]
MDLLWVLILVLLSLSRYNMAMADSNSVSHSGNALNLESVRDSLIRQEDTIVFSLIERARYPVNSRLYNQTLGLVPGFSRSLVHFIVKETEAIQAKAGRYENPEENPFFPNGLPPSVVPTHKYPQALSRRIHYGKYVAEVKFREAPQDYEPLIRAKDRDALMNLLTFKNVEEMVKKRVAKKATVFGQEVTLGNNSSGNYKIDPLIVSHLYAEWVMPLTKLVEVEYLLRRLD